MLEIIRRHSFFIAFFTLLLVIFFYESIEGAAIERISGFTMGTSYEIQLVDIPISTNLAELSGGIAELLFELDREVFSTYAEDSELSKFNRLGINSPYAVSNDLLAVLRLSKEIAIESGGVFDVTIGPVVNLWGFGPGRFEQGSLLPSDNAIKNAMTNVGVENLILNIANSEISKTKSIKIDLSGIAKGYAVDQVAVYLESHGVTNYFIEIGGEIKVSGLKPGN